jgi:heat shock protein HslJ
MTYSRRGTTASIVGAAMAGLLLVTALPAMAGDSAAASSPVGNWKTATNGVKQTITFTSDGKVFGDSGCNRFTGGYTVKGNRIKVGPLAGTLMACPQRQMDAETAFLTKLQAAKTYSSTSTVLKLYTTKDVLRLRAA